MGAPATPEELLGRLAALVCEGDEVTVDEIRTGLAASIDQTLLDPSAGPERVAAWARDNAGEGYATLCVQPCSVGRVAWELERLGSPTRACCVVAFPMASRRPRACASRWRSPLPPAPASSTS